MFDNLPSFSFKVPVIAESFVLPILYSALNYIAPSKALLSSYHFAALLFDCKLFYHHYTNSVNDIASLADIITASVINNVFGIMSNGGGAKHYTPFVINIIMKIIHYCALYNSENIVSDSLFYTIEFNKKTSEQSEVFLFHNP